MTMGDRIKPGAKVSTDRVKEPTDTDPDDRTGQVTSPHDRAAAGLKRTGIPAQGGAGSR